MQRVKKCSNSTLVEAWALVNGFPSEFNEEEVNAIGFEADKSYENLVNIPSISLVPKDKPVMPPFWMSQKSWSNNNYTCRFGHKYLSVHFLNNSGKNSYSSYEKSLRKDVDRWVNIFKKTLKKPSDEKVARLLFGYANRFEFDSKKFDLTDYFNVSYGLILDNVGEDLNELDLKFTLFDKSFDGNFGIRLKSEPLRPNGILPIRTEVYAYKTSFDDLTFNKPKSLMKEIDKVKEFAKKVFFDLATKRTHDLMGASYYD